MKKYFKIMFVATVLLVLAGCTPQSDSSGGSSEEALSMEPSDEGVLPAPMYPLSVGRTVSGDTSK